MWEFIKQAYKILLGGKKSKALQGDFTSRKIQLANMIPVKVNKINDRSVNRDHGPLDSEQFVIEKFGFTKLPIDPNYRFAKYDAQYFYFVTPPAGWTVEYVYSLSYYYDENHVLRIIAFCKLEETHLELFLDEKDLDDDLKKRLVR